MAIILDILENESINLSLDEPEVMGLSVDETTVIRENDYNYLIHKPSIEGNVLEGDKTYEQLGLLSLTNSELEEMLTL